MTPHWTAAFAVALTLTSQANADDAGVYLKAFGGISSYANTAVTGDVTGDASFGNGMTAGGGVGYDYGSGPWRSEIEWTYRSAEAKTFGDGVTGDFASTTLMLNGYFDFASSGRLTPFVGAGVGYVTEVDWDILGGSAPGEYSNDGGVAVQFMGGVTYQVTDRVGLIGELRYFDAGNVSLEGTSGRIEADQSSIDALFGVIWAF